MLVGFPAGGPVDLTARTLAETVKPHFPQVIAVVNKPGGASGIATADSSGLLLTAIPFAWSFPWQLSFYPILRVFPTRDLVIFSQS